MNFAPPIRLGLAEWGRDERAFDGASYLYVNEDVRDEIGFDVEGAWRHWTSVGHAQGRYPPGIGRAAPRHVDPVARDARPLGLNVFGPFEAISGLGTAARNLLEAVRATGLPNDIHPYDVETGQAELTASEQARPVRYRINLMLANADQIRRLVGLYPDGTFDDAYTIAVWAWELACFRADWHASFGVVDEVWTNSHFERASIAASSPVPVHLIPLAVPPPEPIDRNKARARFAVPQDAFVFLCPFDAGSTVERKNPSAAIEAFRDAFGTDPRRVLLVKYHGAADATERQLVETRAGAGNVRLIGARLSEADQGALRSAADALVSSHRSEGFGLNLAEFLAAGRIVIGTDYSGSRDFLDCGSGLPIAARLRAVGRRAGPYLPHLVWAEPDRDALASAMREAASGAGLDARRERGRTRMLADFSAGAIAERMRARIAALDMDSAVEDGLAATSLVSLALHVPPDPSRTRIAWPARLPLLTIVGGLGLTELDGLRRQSYPFWEICLVADELPPTEDNASRAALRRGEMRVRLLEGSSLNAVPAIAAAEAGSGSWIAILSPDLAWPDDALLQVARALDSDEPPDLLTLGRPLAAAPPFVVRKSALLDAWARTASFEAALDRVAQSGRIAHLPGLAGDDPGDPPVRLPPGARISLRGPGEPTRDDGLIDVAELPERRIQAQARAIGRGPGAEHVILVRQGSRLPDRMTAETLLGWLAAPAGAVASADLLATTRSVLEAVGGQRGSIATVEDAVASLGLALVRLPLAPLRLAPSLGSAEPDEVLTPQRHAARLAALGLFDREHYLVSSPDVAASGVDPLAHYVEYGWREHRAPNFYFDPVWYRARYMQEDEDEALDPLLHYERYRHSGVRPARHFDPAWVRRSRRLPPAVDPLRHFLERRRVEDVSPLPEFDPAWYRARRRDIAYRKVDPFEHYMRFGAAEGVNPSADFDTAFYAARHMGEVRQRDPIANNPLLHYLENRDRQPAITSLKAALRQEIARLQLLGRPFIEMSFCWFDGLPQRVDALRTYLAEPTLTMPFLLVFANEFLAAAAIRAGDDRLVTALRLPLGDGYDDADICARLAECFADARCLRRDERPVLAVMRGPDTVPAFAARLARRLRIEHGVNCVIELVD